MHESGLEKTLEENKDVSGGNNVLKMSSVIFDNYLHEVEEFFNPLKRFRKKVEAGCNKYVALSSCREYEKSRFYQNLIQPSISALIWVRNALKSNGNNGRAKAY